MQKAGFCISRRIGNVMFVMRTFNPAPLFTMAKPTTSRPKEHLLLPGRSCMPAVYEWLSRAI
jgi:hypothetical protein